MDLDALMLSRIQFAANISFHILFPTITIALCWFLLFFRIRLVRTRDPAWEEAYYFWTKVFALTFALGVMSGIVMSFQFGTNWPGFMEKTGNISGPLLGYEVLTAFFLEASFLGIMLFGRGRVSERVHLTATFLVALGTTLSAFWILSLNSWMQTPAGYEIVDGQFIPTDWFSVVFNPSFPYRFAHKLLASALTAAFLISGLCAWQLLKGTATNGTHKAMRAAVATAAVVMPLQFIAGDLHGLNTLEHQPAKVAAMEGVWETERGAPLTLFGIPDEEAATTHFAIKIPKMASLILTHDLDGEIAGIRSFGDARPPVGPVFYAFRIMVGVGSLMLVVSAFTAYRLWRQRKEKRITLPRPLLWVLSAMTFSGWLATLSGWYVTEIGRQPFVVYGLVRASEVATTVPPPFIGLTLMAYLLVYGLLLVTYVGVLKYMAENPVKHAPVPVTSAGLGKAGV
jgi:cytochrome d ubiquinol oxidase subunit I